MRVCVCVVHENGNRITRAVSADCGTVISVLKTLFTSPPDLLLDLIVFVT